MLSELRQLALDYNCYVFDCFFLKSNIYQISCLDIDLLTECMKKINNSYDIIWFSKLYKDDDLLCFYYFLEI